MARIVVLLAGIACLFLPCVSRGIATADVLRTEAQLLALTSHAGRAICTSNCLAGEVQAHKAAGEAFLQVALDSRREVSWRVYRLADGTYSYSFPAVGERGATWSRMPPLEAGLTYVSAGHIHWDDVLQFSAQDWLWVTANRRRLFLVTREGELREAAPARVSRLGRQGGLQVRSAVSFKGRTVAHLDVSTAP